MFHLSNPMELSLKCKQIIKKNLRYFHPSSCFLEPGKERIFNKTTYHLSYFTVFKENILKTE